MGWQARGSVRVQVHGQSAVCRNRVGEGSQVRRSAAAGTRPPAHPTTLLPHTARPKSGHGTFGRVSLALAFASLPAQTRPFNLTRPQGHRGA
jgi:hypothetical protein